MMVFFVTSLIEEANAVIIGPFATTGTTFSDIKGGMTTGKFIEYPTAVLGGTVVIWTTDSVGFFGGLEQIPF